MVNFGYPYNDIVICKDSTDYLRDFMNILSKSYQNTTSNIGVSLISFTSYSETTYTQSCHQKFNAFGAHIIK